MFRNVIILIAIVTSLATKCWAAKPYTPVMADPVLEPWRWTSFPELKGLGLECLAEDSEGNIWFGVDDGVRVYDGVSWTAYTSEDGIVGNDVSALLATSDGSVFAGLRLRCEYR